MNLLTDKTPDFLIVGGEKINIKTDFFVWVRFLISFEKNDIEAVERSFVEIFGGVPNKSAYADIINAIYEWLNLADESYFKSGKKNAECISFQYDGNVIYAEMWKYFPHMMKKGITYQEGMELINLLLGDEKTNLWHRAYARSGDFSKLDKEQKKYWEKERIKYRLPLKNKQENTDDILSRAF